MSNNIPSSKLITSVTYIKIITQVLNVLFSEYAKCVRCMYFYYFMLSGVLEAPSMQKTKQPKYLKCSFRLFCLLSHSTAQVLCICSMEANVFWVNGSMVCGSHYRVQCNYYMMHDDDFSFYVYYTKMPKSKFEQVASFQLGESC